MKFLTKEDFYYRHLRHMEIVERQIVHAGKIFGPHISQVKSHDYCDVCGLAYSCSHGAIAHAQVVIIMDLANMSFKPDRHAIPLFKQMIHIDVNYYPERLGAFFIINAPWIFKSLWALVRPWLDARTQRKFHVLGSDYAARLREYISEDQLPVEYGGSNPAQVSRPASNTSLHSRSPNAWLT
jgi:hypothetical protein